ncbi:hypothetical protein CEXT_92071 [Caerostris extrusa]|uniref:Uncharacterized protein n=1 Tax=Caerostris extrusa TaxID=172846 RepID=A0AAV4NES7_CAEEX|nr:hypothetical protein CEXT_92071 [Caerostris extrusa]
MQCEVGYLRSNSSTVLKDTRLEDQITMCIDAEWEGSVAHWCEMQCEVRCLRSNSSTVLKDTRLEDQITMCIDAEWEGSVAHWLVKCSVRLDSRSKPPYSVRECWIKRSL